jgi:DNA-binding response OmpR family regulator
MSKKIFIIEDDANLLSSLKAKFSIGGFQVETDNGAGTAEEVIKNIKVLNPNFIILDLILPKVDGFSILSKIKSDKDTLNIPVFVFTNLSDEDSKERSKDLGSDYYFIKSNFSVDEFVEKFKKIIINKEK